MKTKRIILLMLVFASITISVNAQIEVFSGGTVSVGSANAPSIGVMQVYGNSVFSTNQYPSCSAYIRGNTSNSTATNPDYAWYNNDQVGLFHPASNVIGFTIGGVEAMRINSNGYLGIGTTSPNNLLQVKALIDFDPTYYNTFLGISAGISTTGTSNTAIGFEALYDNSTGYSNTASGLEALWQNTTGYDNTAIGWEAGQINTTGSKNTFVGYGTNAGANNLTDATAIGNGAITTANDNVVIGITTIAKVGGWVNWTNYSDRRFKTNVTENVKGLAFIKKLRPVTFNVDTKAADDFIIQNMPDSVKARHQAGMNFATSTAIVHSGFIAQEVDSVAQLCGFNSSIVYRPTNSTDLYALAYGEFVVPLVKAVQELSKTNDSLKSALKTTDSLLTVFQKQVNTTTTNLQQQINNCCNKGSITKTLNTDSTSQNSTSGINNISTTAAAILYQNTPNPFSQQTQIKCFIPANAIMSYIYIYDMQGTQLRKIQVNGNGNEAITIQGSEFRSGMYMYTLIIDGKVIDTKKMILTD
jgi:hypothetical protein